ncbi:MAG: hypothetical protein U0T56_08815 [Ferruginibacter sp.]
MIQIDHQYHAEYQANQPFHTYPYAAYQCRIKRIVLFDHTLFIQW